MATPIFFRQGKGDVSSESTTEHGHRKRTRKMKSLEPEERSAAPKSDRTVKLQTHEMMVAFFVPTPLFILPAIRLPKLF